MERQNNNERKDSEALGSTIAKRPKHVTAINIAIFSVMSAICGRTAIADAIPYPHSGVYNPIIYTFTASTTGKVTAYFAGSDATHENRLGMLDNGVLTSAGYGLDDHTSSVGQSFNLGQVTAGDTLTFVLDDLTLGAIAYSDPTLNVPYDVAGETIGHNHVYSTAYTDTSPVFNGVPVGTYVAFEDLRFPNSDFSYADENFVFTNVKTSVPEPSGLTIATLGTGILISRSRQKKRAVNK